MKIMKPSEAQERDLTAIATTIATAIQRSITHTEIVTIDGNEDTLRGLQQLADDSTLPMLLDDGRCLTECWGREDCDDWRVHVITGRPTPPSWTED